MIKVKVHLAGFMVIPWKACLDSVPARSARGDHLFIMPLNTDDGCDHSRQVWSFWTSPQIPFYRRKRGFQLQLEGFLIAEMGNSKTLF
jgi:hypothetical protein